MHSGKTLTLFVFIVALAGSSCRAPSNYPPQNPYQPQRPGMPPSGGGAAVTIPSIGLQPQVTPLLPPMSQPARMAGGRFKNSPYVIRGIQYFPMTPEQALFYQDRGMASWYGAETFGSGKETANGEYIDHRSLSAAHRYLPLPCIVRVTNLRNGRSVDVRVNDRGPYKPDRVIDLSVRAAEVLDFKQHGLTEVEVQMLQVGG